MTRGLFAILVLLTACGDDSSQNASFSATDSALLGEWALRSIDGNPVSENDPVELVILENPRNQTTSMELNCSGRIELVAAESHLEMTYAGDGRNGCHVNFLYGSAHSILVGAGSAPFSYEVSGNELILISDSHRFILSRPSPQI